MYNYTNDLYFSLTPNISCNFMLTFPFLLLGKKPLPPRPRAKMTPHHHGNKVPIPGLNSSLFHCLRRVHPPSPWISLLLVLPSHTTPLSHISLALHRHQLHNEGRVLLLHLLIEALLNNAREYCIHIINKVRVHVCMADIIIMFPPSPSPSPSPSFSLSPPVAAQSVSGVSGGGDVKCADPSAVFLQLYHGSLLTHDPPLLLTTNEVHIL